MENSGNLVVSRLLSFLPEAYQNPITETAIGVFLLLGISAILHFLIRAWIISLITKLGKKANHPWYDAILENKLPQRALFILPLLIFYIGIDWVSQFPEDLLNFFMRLINATMILVVARTIDSFLSTIHSIHLLSSESKRRPIKSYIQMGKVIVYIITAILIIAQLANQSPWYFLSGIGAMTAIVLLIFRDTLLSLVASIQLTGNDVVRVGDWIEMPQFGADGDVVDIALNTVRVQNWDKTITVIPTHKFLDHSFRNWRGMQESGGRRIMRNLLIDIESVRFLSLAEVERLKESYLLKDYITRKLEDVHAYNKSKMTKSSVITNGRWLTNIGTFRAYAYEYLKHHPNTHKELLTIVRQMEPTAQGLPLQIYAFANSTQWAIYEQIQADIFDHLLSILPEFGLRHFQQPSGWDFDKISNNPGFKD